MTTRGLAIIAFAAAVAGAGCAQEPLPQPSFLGMGELVAQETTPMPGEGAINPALRHINSNRVLGAMAFQKVTGRSVDPQSLVGPAGGRN